MVKFGLFDHIEGIANTPHGQLLKDRTELIKAADEAGFYAYHLAEHHGTDLCMAPNQEIFLSSVAAQTKQIRLGPLVKLLPLHPPVGIIEDICLFDQLSGGRAEYGVGRGIAAIEHFWYEGDWFASHSRFDEALAIILEGLQTGKVEARERQHYNFPPITFAMSPVQAPNPPMWYPGNPVVAGRHGLNLVWPGPIPKEAYDLYVETWEKHKDDPVRADRPGDKPKVGSTLLFGVHREEAEAKAIAARGYRGLMRRVVDVHTYDRLALTDQQAEEALNPLARAALEVVRNEAATMPNLVVNSGTPAYVQERLAAILEEGRTEYLIMQFPTGDMTYAEARGSLDLFIEEVQPALEKAF